jgi:hypothetical protein
MADGKVIETWVFIDDHAEAEHFWSVATPRLVTPPAV